MLIILKSLSSYIGILGESFEREGLFSIGKSHRRHL
jgi:hypothetical protein